MVEALQSVRDVPDIILPPPHQLDDTNGLGILKWNGRSRSHSNPQNPLKESLGLSACVDGSLEISEAH